MKPIASKDMTLAIKELGVSCESMTVTTLPSDKVTSPGGGLYFGEVKVSLVAPVYNGFIAPAAVATLEPSAINVSDDGGKALLEGDEAATLHLTGMNSSSVTKDFDLTLYVIKAGQEAILAD